MFMNSVTIENFKSGNHTHTHTHTRKSKHKGSRGVEKGEKK